MYKSPIDIIHGELELKFEDEICKAVRNIGIVVDKDELIKALKYDRVSTTRVTAMLWRPWRSFGARSVILAANALWKTYLTQRECPAVRCFVRSGNVWPTQSTAASAAGT